MNAELDANGGGFAAIIWIVVLFVPGSRLLHWGPPSPGGGNASVGGPTTSKATASFMIAASFAPPSSRGSSVLPPQAARQRKRVRFLSMRETYYGFSGLTNRSVM